MSRILSLILALLLCPVVLAQTVAPHAPDFLQDARMDDGKLMRWSDDTRTIAVYIPNGSPFPVWHPRTPDILWMAFQEWQRALEGRLTFIAAPNPEAADIIIQWAGYHPHEAGLAHMQQIDQYFAGADFNISLYDASANLMPPDLLYNTCLHEIGHVLGIHGHSANSRDVMYYQQTQVATHLSARDINTMRLIYRQKADITNPPGVSLAQMRAYQKAVQLAEAASEQKDHASVLTYFTLALSHFPNSDYAHYGAGVSAYNLDRYAEALAHFQAIPASSAKIEPPLYLDLQAFCLYQLAYQEERVQKRPTSGIRTKMQQSRELYARFLAYQEIATSKRAAAEKMLASIDRYLFP